MMLLFKMEFLQKKIDKECLILNTSDTQGTIVFYVDNNNYDAQYFGCGIEEGKKQAQNRN